MPTSKKGKVNCKPCKGKKSGSCNTTDVFEGYLTDLTSHKMTVFILMAAVFGLGAMLSVVLGVSAATL